MTYVTEQTSQELRSHMRRLKGMAGWHEPLADRLYREILELDEKIQAFTVQPAAQPAVERQPLTGGQIDNIIKTHTGGFIGGMHFVHLARAIEQAHGIGNPPP